MAKKGFMNPQMGAHMDAAGLGDEPEPVDNPQEEAGEEQNQTITCPMCGGKLSIEPAAEAESEHAALAPPVAVPRGKGPIA